MNQALLSSHQTSRRMGDDARQESKTAGHYTNNTYHGD
ncbi:hypothetical protein D083_4101 [Dickeya solani RNS 08.23.3.1.A]|nr:hypothetical protein D083_4101 [Dickeya solani RNS 08.23.3.1.A]